MVGDCSIGTEKRLSISREQPSRKTLTSRERKTLLIKLADGYLPILGIMKYLMNL